MAFFTEFTNEDTGLALTSMAEFGTVPSGSIFKRNDGTRYIKTATGTWEKTTEGSRKAVTNLFYNPGFEVAQRFASYQNIGYTGNYVLTTVDTNTYTLDRWIVNTSGQGTKVYRDTNVPSTNSRYSMRIGGQTSITSVRLKQRFMANEIQAGVITISIWVYNNTAAEFTPSILLGTPDAYENYTTVTNRLNDTLSPCPVNVWKKLTYTTDISGFTNINNGFEFAIQIPSGYLNDISKNVYFAEAQLESGDIANKFVKLDYASELQRCKYFMESVKESYNTLQYYIGIGQAYTYGSFDFSISYSEKRTIPQISWIGSQPIPVGIRLFNGAAAGITLLNVLRINKKNVELSGTCSPVPTTQTGCTAFVVGDGTITIDAEL